MFKRISIGKWLLGLSFLLTLVHAFTARADFSPERLARLLEMKVTHHGPNCWNTSLVAAGLLPWVRFTSAEEFRFLMDSPVCERVAAEELQAGDIQIWVSSNPELSLEQREVHTSFWLSRTQLFNKMTAFATASYNLTTPQEVNQHYAFTPEIFKFNLKNPQRQWQCRGEAECRNVVEYRRCGSLEMAKKSDPQYSPEIESVLSRVETSLEKQLQSPARWSSTFVINLKGMLFELEGLRAHLCVGSHGFYCSYTRERLRSLQGQLEKTQPSWLMEAIESP